MSHLAKKLTLTTSIEQLYIVLEDHFAITQEYGADMSGEPGFEVADILERDCWLNLSSIESATPREFHTKLLCFLDQIAEGEHPGVDALKASIVNDAARLFGAPLPIRRRPPEVKLN